MTFKFKPVWIVAVFIAGYALYVIILALLGLPNPVYTSDAHEIGYDSLLKPFDPVVSDSVNYVTYKKLTDSIKTMRSLKDGEYYSYHGTQLAELLATNHAGSCDTCTLRWITKEYSAVGRMSQSYLSLPGWKLNIQTETRHFWTDDSVQFYVEHNQAYIRKFVRLDYIPKDKYRNYHMIDLPVRFRYDSKLNCIKIPVSKTVTNVTGTVLAVIGIMFGLYSFLLMGYFFWFLVEVSKGNIFTDENMIRLKTIAYSLIAIPFILLFLNLLLRPIFLSYLTSDVVLKVDTLNGYWKMLALGVVFLIIYLSFKQGKKLKDEQELTI